MWLSHLSIRRPYFAFMINLAIIIFGLIAYKKIPIARDPNIDLPMVWININYPDASPLTEEDLVLKPLEDAVKGLSGIKNMYGTAKEGSADLFIEFNLDISGDKAYEDVRTAVSNIKFPDGTKAPEIYKIKMNSDPIFEISVSAPTMSTEELSEILKDTIQPRIQRVSGVSAVYLYGDRYREIHIDLKQNELKALNISPLYVKRTVENYIFNINAGQFKEPGNDYTLSVYNIPNSLDSIAKIPISTDNQKLIHLENVANVQDGTTESTSYAEYNGTPSLTISVDKETQGNVVRTATEIKAVIDEMNKEYKDKISLRIIEDDSKYIQNSVNGVKWDILLGSLFAVLTVFLFLHEWKNTLICMVAIPTSLIGALAVIHALHFSLNTMTLFALTLCVGIVIDDAIVVVENIHRHRDLGKNPMLAAKEGTDEIGFAAIAVTIAIISVFIPIAFMQGIIGRFFYEFGMTVVVAVCISLFVAFTAVPMFSSLVKNDMSGGIKDSSKKYFALAFDRYFEKFQVFYLKMIRKILQFKKTTLFCALLVFIASVALLKFVPITFNEEGDKSIVNINFNLEQNTSLDISKIRGAEIAKYIKNLPGVQNVLMKIGSDQNGATNKIKFDIFLVHKNKRKFSDKEFLIYLTNSLKQFIQNPLERVGFSSDDYPLQISLLSNKPELLKKYSSQLVSYMDSLPDVQGSTTSAEDPIIEYRVTPNQTQSNLMNVNPLDLANTLQLLFNGVIVGKYNDSGKYFNIKMMLPKQNENSLSDLNSIFIPTQTGSQVLLSSIAKIERVSGLPRIEHLNAERVLNVKANYIGKDLSGTIDKIQEYVKKTSPIAITSKLTGESDNVQEMLSTVGVALLLAVVFVFMVLAVQFENIVAPASILLSIPFAFSGAFLALLVTRNPLNIFSTIGIIMLMGLVTKNAILLIEFAQQRMKEGLNIENALIESASVRLRPIMMTTITMIAGMLPMALSSADGSESSSNIAITVIGGLISSTLLTLLIVPSVYLFFYRTHSVKSGARSGVH